MLAHFPNVIAGVPETPNYTFPLPGIIPSLELVHLKTRTTWRRTLTVCPPVSSLPGRRDAYFEVLIKREAPALVREDGIRSILADGPAQPSVKTSRRLPNSYNW